jgi:hypothetical protein
MRLRVGHEAPVRPSQLPEQEVRVAVLERGPGAQDGPTDLATAKEVTSMDHDRLEDSFTLTNTIRSLLMDDYETSRRRRYLVRAQRRHELKSVVRDFFLDPKIAWAVAVGVLLGSGLYFFIRGGLPL